MKYPNISTRDKFVINDTIVSDIGISFTGGFVIGSVGFGVGVGVGFWVGVGC